MATTTAAPVPVTLETLLVESDYLERTVQADVYLPPGFSQWENLPLLLVNDGQDLPKMPFASILSDLYAQNSIEALFVVALHCGPERKMEYGTAYAADYLGRGAKAGHYTKFIFEELLPAVRKKYQVVSFREKSFAGFSLGGLSALDIAWNHASEFTKVGVFSGSLWWRRKSYEDGYNEETDRLMHLQVRKGVFHPWMRFFVQTGTLDETADRNQNGIIDAIDDALDLLIELRAKGYTDQHLHYLELEDGKHDVPTWARAFPSFLQWGWGK